MIVATAQHPSVDVIPSKLRNQFHYRCAMRCANPAASDIILGDGWATDGYNAAEIDPDAEGIGYLLAHKGVPRKFRGPFLDVDDIRHLVAAGLALRGGEAAA